MSTTSPATDDAFEPQPRRSPPPPAALAWAAAAVGGQRVARVRRLPGATSSVLHELVVALPAGAHCELVLRRYVHPLWGDDGADLVAREALALAAARDAPVAAPELIATDPAGVHADAPALLMTRAPGRPVLHGGPAWLARLAQVYERLASWSATAVDLPAYRPWYPPRPEPPHWSRHESQWAEAIALVTAGPGPSPASASQPLHRDLHPANIVFGRGRPAAVVDWVNACIGPFASELARGRANLAVLAGLDAADAFLAATGGLGRDYDPWWDLSVCVELLPDPTAFDALRALGGRCDVVSARAALDGLVLRALASLG